MNDLLRQDLQQFNKQPLKIRRNGVWLIIIPVVSFFIGILIMFVMFYTELMIIFPGISFFFIFFFVFILLGLNAKKIIRKTWPEWYVYLTIPVVFPAIYGILFMMYFSVGPISFIDNILGKLIISIPLVSFLAGITIIYFKKNKKLIIMWIIVIVSIIIGIYLLSWMVNQSRGEIHRIAAEKWEKISIERTYRNDQRVSDIFILMDALTLYYEDNEHYPISKSSNIVADILPQFLYPKYINNYESNDFPLLDPLKSEFWYEYSSDGQNYRLIFLYEHVEDKTSEDIKKELSKSIIDYRDNYIEGVDYNVTVSRRSIGVAGEMVLPVIIDIYIKK